MVVDAVVTAAVVVQAAGTMAVADGAGIMAAAGADAGMKNTGRRTTGGTIQAINNSINVAVAKVAATRAVVAIRAAVDTKNSTIRAGAMTALAVAVAAAIRQAAAGSTRGEDVSGCEHSP